MRGENKNKKEPETILVSGQLSFSEYQIYAGVGQ